MAWVLKTPPDPYHLTTSSLVLLVFSPSYANTHEDLHQLSSAQAKLQVFSFADIYLFLKK